MMDVFQRFGVRTVRADLTDPKNLDSLLLLQQGDDIHTTTTTTTLVWIETPSNPLCHVIDIAAICQHVQSLALTERRVTVVVDSTLAPPTLSQPLVLGADLVMHSATKYLGGHSDVLLGVVTASPWTEQGRALVPMLKGIQMNVGGVASPMDCWLCLRGMRTLAVRVARQSATALTLAQHLVSKGVTVHYPGLELHPHHAIAQKQMKGGYGGILSVEFDTAAMAMAVAGALRTVHRATSLGGTETLIEHRASIEPPGRVTSPEGLLRVSIGLEDVTDLIKDFDGAIDIARQVLAGI